jgi:O-antigen ligase
VTAPSRIRRIALGPVLIGLIVLTPLPFGSVEPWAVLIIEGATACLAMLSLAILLREPGALTRRGWVALLPPALLVLIAVLQLLPSGFPGSVRAPAPTTRTRAEIGRVLPEAVPADAPQSLSAPDTLDALLRILACIGIGVATAVAARDRTVFRRISLAIVVSGTFQAFYGMAEYLSGHQHIFAYAKRYYVEDATGTFINRNHFASYLAMTLPFALAHVLSLASDPSKTRRLRDGILRIAGPRSVRRALSGSSVATIWSGILLSYSRGGLAASLVGAAIPFAARRRGRRTAILAGVILLGPLLLLLWMDVQAPGERLLLLGADASAASGRLTVWRETLRLLPSYLPFGSGFGTFEATFASHQPAEITKHYDHAHNDWLQCLLEGGIGALVSCVALLAIVVSPSRRRGGPADEFAAFRIAPVAGVIAIALHSLVDFSLRIPAVWVLAAVLAGLAVSRDEDPDPRAVPLAVVPAPRS